MRARLVFVGGLMLSVVGCASTNVPGGEQAYTIIPPPSDANRPDDYRIGPLDVLKITVFQEPDLSLNEVPVDASGNIIVPLIGQVQAAGKTSRELSQDIAGRLGDRFLVNPQVSLIVARSVSQRVTVEGQVTKPGVYAIEGQTTLLQAVALAEGPTDIANTSEVIVFRRLDGKQYAAKFNLAAIRTGAMQDPEVLGSDVVVVGASALKGIYQDFLKVSPLLGSVFIALNQN